MTVDAKLMVMYGINGKKRLVVPYQNPSNLPMIFDVVPFHREA